MRDARSIMKGHDMPLHESGEDYLEAILMLSQEHEKVRSVDVADRLGVTKASVSKAAEQMLERHKFFVNLLERAGVPADVAAAEGCHMEHCLSEDSFEKLRSMLEPAE